MANMKAITVVYETTDYSIFKRLPENRGLTQNRLDKLVASFSEKEIMNPIIVNKHFEIIDGQGRFDAKKILGLPIYYIIDPDATIDDCRRMNTYNTPWTDYNYIESYANGGNESYIIFKRLVDTYKLPIDRALRYANKAVGRGTTSSRTGRNFVRTGRLTFTESDADNVVRTLKYAQEIIEALALDGKQNNTFYVAVKVITDNERYSHRTMIENCRRCRNSYVPASSLESELKELSKVYNYRKNTNNRVYFEDYMRGKGYNSHKSYDSNGDIFEHSRSADVSTLGRNDR